MEQNQNTSLFSLNLDAQNSYTLRSAASWAKVLGVVSLIIGILCVIAGILVQQAVSKYGGDLDGYDLRRSGVSMNALGNMGMAIYLILGLVYIISGVFAMNAGNKINRGLRANDQATLNAGFAGARNFFALWAILLILMLLLMLIGVLGNMGN